MPSSHTFTSHFQIEVPSGQALCPDIGYHSFVDDNCGPAFVKCSLRADGSLEGSVFKCPSGYSYWGVSRRCERTAKLPNCKRSRLSSVNNIPTDWINLGKARKLRF